MDIVEPDIPVDIELNGIPTRIIIRKGQSDPAHGIINAEMPLAKELLGAKKGEVKEFTVEGRGMIQKNIVLVVAINP